MHTSTDPAVYTVVVEDFAALGGLTVAFIGVVSAHAFRAPWMDGAASVAIGAVLCAAAVVLGLESRGLLVGESASPRLVESVRRIAASDPAVRRVGDPLTMLLGSHEVLVNLAIELDPLLSSRDVVLAIARIEAKVREKHPNVRRIFLEACVLDRTHDTAVVGSVSNGKTTSGPAPRATP